MFCIKRNSIPDKELEKRLKYRDMLLNDNISAQMVELVDTLVSGTSAARYGSSSLLLGNKANSLCHRELADLCFPENG